MAEEFFAIQGDPLAAVLLAVRQEPLLRLRHPARIRAWSRNIGDRQQDMLFVLHSDKGSSGRKSPSSNIASACWVTISFYRDRLGSSWEASDRAPGESRATRRVPHPPHARLPIPW
jgi:hypothetical protein